MVTATLVKRQVNTEFLKSELLTLIEDYHWKFDTVQELQERIFGFHLRVSYGVAQYGIDMVMPRGCSGKSAAELDAMEKRERRRYKQLLNYKAEIDLIDYIPVVTRFESRKMEEMFEEMQAGKKLAEIALRFGQDRKTARSMRNRMLNLILKDEYVRKFLEEGFTGKVINTK